MAQVTSPGTVIRVNVRHGWYQRTEMGLRTKGLEIRMRQIAAADLQRLDWAQTIVVTAESGTRSRTITMSRQEWAA